MEYFFQNRTLITNVVHNHINYLHHSEVIVIHYDLKPSYVMLHQQQVNATS